MRLLILALAAVLGITPCRAAGWSERWSATSTTAAAITGDVTLKTSEILFANGKSLPISKLRNVAFTDDTASTAPATIYRITAPADPALLQGNRLCGGPKPVPVTFVVIWHTRPIMPGEAAGRALAVFSGPVEPAPTAQNACGIYRYEVAK